MPAYYDYQTAFIEAVFAGPAKIGKLTMAQWLAARDDAWLTALLTARPDLAAPVPPEDFAALAKRALTSESLTTARRALDTFSLGLLDTLCLLPERTDISAILDVLGAGVEHVDAERALGGLVDLALAFPDAGKVLIQPVLRHLDDYPADLGPPLTELFSRKSASELNRLATKIGVRPGRTKADSLAVVGAALADPATVRQLVVTGPPEVEQIALRLATTHPELGVPYGIYSPHEQTPLGYLLSRGLITALSWDRAVMPREIGLALRGGTPYPGIRARRPELVRTPVDTASVDRAGAECALQLVRDIAALLDDFADTPARPLKAGGLGVREVRRVAKLTGRGERDAARLIQLAEVAGVLAADYSAEVAAPTSAYDDWLALDSAARWAQLAECWRHADVPLGAAGGPDHNGKPSAPMRPGMADPDTLRLRERFLAALAEGAGRAEETSLCDQLDWDAPLLWRTQVVPPPVLVRTLLEEVELLGLGVDGALTSAGRLMARGEPAAAALAAFTPPVIEKFVVQADLTAIASGELSRAVRTELELLADIESAGSATVYRFSPLSLRRGFDAGYTEAAILAFLDEHASHGVPQPLAYLVGDLARRFGRLRVGTARCFLRADDPALAAEVCGNTAVARLGLRQIAPTVLVCDADPTVLLDRLRGAGYLPAREGADGELVVSRPRPRRVAGPARPKAARVAPPTGSAGPVQLDKLIGRLRAAGCDDPRPPARPVVPARHLRAVPDDDEMMGVFDDETLDVFAALEDTDATALPRPTAIAHGATAVRDVLGQACEQDWLIRLCVAGAVGTGKPYVAAINAIVDDVVHLETIPDGDDIATVLSQVEWVRVLTYAEELQLLI